MPSRSRSKHLAIALILALSAPALQSAQFVYQGSLTDLGQPANGRFDLRLSAYGDEQQGTTLVAPINFYAVNVKDGRFQVDVDLPVTAQSVWLGVEVRSVGDTAFSAIGGRSKAIAAPLIGTCWSTTGDSGSSAANFIGTTDIKPFVVRTLNVQSLRIEPNTDTFANPITANIIAGSSANNVTLGVRGATIAGGGVPSGDTDPVFDNEAPNRVTDSYGTVGGGYANRAGDAAGTASDNPFATVGGGKDNIASEGLSTVGGGVSNRASGANSTVGGGFSNRASGVSSSVGGGGDNSASQLWSTVSGGDENSASGVTSTVGGGQGNVASALFGGSTVSGGSDNTASGVNSTVSGGRENCAGGDYSWVGGDNAKVRPGSESGDPGIGCLNVPQSGDSDGHEGTFVWADDLGGDFVSTGANQFLVRAAGGMAINSNNPLGNELRVNGTIRVDVLGSTGATPLCRNTNEQISTCSSSARYKQDIADLKLGLDTALQLRAVAYRWKDSGTADLGFIAEEIAKIDERLITRNDAGEIEGVKYERLTAVLANAVQELAARDSVAQDALVELRAANADLRTRLERLEASLSARAVGAQ